MVEAVQLYSNNPSHVYHIPERDYTLDLSNRKTKHDEMDHEFVLFTKEILDEQQPTTKKYYLRFHCNSKGFDRVSFELIYNELWMIPLISYLLGIIHFDIRKDFPHQSKEMFINSPLFFPLSSSFSSDSIGRKKKQIKVRVVGYYYSSQLITSMNQR